MNVDLSKVTRLEIIDHTKNGNGRAYVNMKLPAPPEFSLQDDGRTLKIFLSEPKK